MAIETIILQAETLNLVGTDSLARTRTANQEKDGVNGLGADVPGPNDQNTGSPDFDDYGLRPNYGGDGYVDINGGAGDKITFQVNDGGDLAVPAGSYDLTLRAASSSNRAVKIVVDGVDQGAPQTVNTGEFYLWDTYTFAIDVPATPGPHTVVIEQTTSAGPNVDAIAISDVGATVEFPVTPLLPPAPEPVIEQILLQGEAADIPPAPRPSTATRSTSRTATPTSRRARRAPTRTGCRSTPSACARATPARATQTSTATAPTWPPATSRSPGT